MISRSDLMQVVCLKLKFNLIHSNLTQFRKKNWLPVTKGFWHFSVPCKLWRGNLSFHSSLIDNSLTYTINQRYEDLVEWVIRRFQFTLYGLQEPQKELVFVQQSLFKHAFHKTSGVSPKGALLVVVFISFKKVHFQLVVQHPLVEIWHEKTHSMCPIIADVWTLTAAWKSCHKRRS